MGGNGKEGVGPREAGDVFLWELGKAFVLRWKGKHVEPTRDAVCFMFSKDHSGCCADNRRQDSCQGDQLGGRFRSGRGLVGALAGLWQWKC